MTDKSPRVEAAQANGAFLVEHCDVPAEMTIGEWRRHCADEQRRCQDSRPAGVRGKLKRALRRG